MKKRFITLGVSLLFLTVVVALLFIFSPERKITLSPPVAGLGKAISMKITEYHPPLHLTGGKLMSNEPKPLWFEADTLPGLFDHLPYDEFARKAGAEFIKDRGVTRELYEAKLKMPKPETRKKTIFYTVTLTCAKGRFILIVATWNELLDVLPGPNQLALEVVKFSQGAWRPYRTMSDDPIATLSWNDLTKLQAIVKVRSAHLDETGLIIAD